MWIRGHRLRTHHGHQGADALVRKNLQDFVSFLFWPELLAIKPTRCSRVDGTWKKTLNTCRKWIVILLQVRMEPVLVRGLRCSRARSRTPPSSPSRKTLLPTLQVKKREYISTLLSRKEHILLHIAKIKPRLFLSKKKRSCFYFSRKSRGVLATPDRGQGQSQLSKV